MKKVDLKPCPFCGKHVLDDVGLLHTGSYRNQEEKDELLIVEVDGVRIAVLSYLTNINYYPVEEVNADTPWLTSIMPQTKHSHYDALIEEIEADFAQARESGADLIAVMIHWGVEYQTKANAYQQEMADFFLKNRITLTGGAAFCDTVGREWLENPRVTSIRVLSKKQYDEFKDDPILSKKMFFYGQDEPGVPRGWRPINWPDGTNETVFDNTGLLSILAVRREADMLKNNWGWNNYRLLIPYERTMDFTAFDFDSIDKTTAFPAWYDEYAVGGERDSVEYLADHVNVWTNVFTGATPKKISADVEGCLYMQTEQQNDTCGEYHDRMEGFRARGDELWNYVACEPRYYSPYQNVLLFNDGTEGRTMFWTTYMLHGTGFLYWHISFYDVAGNNTYTLRSPFSKTGPGDGILVYPGAAYGQLDPIPSIRLLNMRDGVEDYELLTMLRTAKGEAFTDALVSQIVTSTVNFTRDDDHIYNVRSYLLRILEEENNK